LLSLSFILFANLLFAKPQNTRDSLTLPNIIIVFADDMGYGDLGCYGATQIETPNIDKIAAAGMRFLDAHSAGSFCQPSRYSLLTGRYWWRSSRFMYGWKHSGLFGYMPEMIEDERPTLATILKQKGYATAAIGKWHLGVNWITYDGKLPEADGSNVDHSKPFTGGPLSHGFDYYFGIIASLNMVPFTFIENNRTVGIPSKIREKDPGNPYIMYEKGLMADGWKDERVGPNLTRKAVNFIESRNKISPEQPFFLYLPLSAPHSPFTPPQFMKGKSRAGARGDMVAEVDWTVGEIIETLDRLHLRENTLLIITSDNGSRIDGGNNWQIDPASYSIEFTNHKPNGYLKGEKGDIWEGGHRVPLIARWPGRIKQGSINRDLVCLSDLMATFASITGTKLSNNIVEDSFDLLPLFSGNSKIETARNNIIHRTNLYSIRTKDWKLIEGQGSGGFMESQWVESSSLPKGQLYYMKKDPIEYQNVWSEFPDTVKVLQQKLDLYKKN
jgi:arylsulfatase A